MRLRSAEPIVALVVALSVAAASASAAVLACRQLASASCCNGNCEHGGSAASAAPCCGAKEKAAYPTSGDGRYRVPMRLAVLGTVTGSLPAAPLLLATTAVQTARARIPTFIRLRSLRR